jgi:S-adenosylmethionine decarboxylase
MGKHYLLNLYGCSLSLLDNEFFLRDLLENAATACGAQVLQTISHQFDPQGVTAICLLSESHISIHTWPEKEEAAVDVFTCGDSNPKIACDIIIEQLYAETYKLDFVER